MTERTKRFAHLAMAVGVAAVFGTSVQCCIARRDDIGGYPIVKGFPPIPGEMRVLLLQGCDCRVAVSGGYEITGGGRVLFNDTRPLPPVTVRATAGGLMLGSEASGRRRVEIAPKNGARVHLNGAAYRGRLLLLADGADSLQAINVVGLDDYLAGVVAGEMPSYWEAEALKAQAIAARTYALYRARERASSAYYVTAGTGDQVYAGIGGETVAARRAVFQTRGLVLLYNWKILPAYYHSVCGGRTAARRAVFGEPDITPLSGVECPYCHPKRHGLKGSKYYRWQVTVPQSQVAAALAARGRKVRGIASIKPVAPDRGGHSRLLRVVPYSGESFVLTVDELREVLGRGKLISTCFECRGADGTLVCRGRGFGHGVGMCQWGARGMAMEGYGFEEILRFYYPGAEVRRIY